ncbi:MAG: hypothetical protein WBV36_05880 [Terriglobales bacterium]
MRDSKSSVEPIGMARTPLGGKPESPELKAGIGVPAFRVAEAAPGVVFMGIALEPTGLMIGAGT